MLAVSRCHPLDELGASSERSEREALAQSKDPGSPTMPHVEHY